MLQHLLVVEAQNLSQIAAFLFFLATILLGFLIVRERRRMRGAVARQVESQVEAAMGQMKDDAARMQEEARQHVGLLAENKKMIQEATELQLAGAKEEIERLHAEVRRARQQATQLTASGDREWISPEAQLRLARQAEDWQQAAEHLAQIDLDTATSRNLEQAGTICREHGFLSKAVELYREAAEKDPENLSARAELLALSAEIDAAERKESLEKLEALVAETMADGRNRAPIQSRFFETMVALGRFRELEDFCEAQLKQPLSREVEGTLHRNLAVLYDDAGRNEAALAHAEAALRASGDDAEMLALATRLLIAMRKYDEAHRSVIRGLQLDPMSVRSYMALAEIQERRLGRAAARDLLKRAVQWADDAEVSAIEGQLRRLDALDELSEIVPATQPQLIRA
jgi:tetratricopeptide (TPR) repeat protein